MQMEIKYYIHGTYMCYRLRTTYMIHIGLHSVAKYYIRGTYLCCRLRLNTTYMMHTYLCCRLNTTYIYDPEMSPHFSSVPGAAALSLFQSPSRQSRTRLAFILQNITSQPVMLASSFFSHLLCISWMVRNSLMKEGVSKEFKKKIKRKKRKHEEQEGKRLVVSRGPAIHWHEMFESRMYL